MFICNLCKKEFEKEEDFKLHLINQHELWENYEGTMNSCFGVADQITRCKVVANNCIGKVLSVGGGDGNVENEIIIQGHELVFTDIDPKRLENAKKYFGIQNGIVANAKDLSMFEDRSFDTVVCCETLEHIKDMGIALQELIRVAKQRIIITFPISDYWSMDQTHQFDVHCTIISRNGNSNVVHEKKDETKASFIVMTFDRINGNI